jgi:hypothetical protein
MDEHRERPGDLSEHEAADAFEELIRRRAFEMSESAGSGSPAENWLRAEREVRAHAGHPPPHPDAEEDAALLDLEPGDLEDLAS